MPSPVSRRSFAAARTRFVPGRTSLRLAGALALASLALVSCSATVPVEKADVPQWQATALPTVPDTVLEDAGKILNRDRISASATDVPAGRYTLTVTCDGGGKAFFAVTLDGAAVVDAGAACNGSKETTRITVASAGAVEVAAYSVDAPLIFAYHLAPAE